MVQYNPGILEHLAETGRRSLCPSSAVRINVGTSSCGLAKGAGLLRDKLAARRDWALPVKVTGVGCLGACFAEPLIHVRLPDGRHYFFGRVDGKSLWHVIRLVEGHQPTSYLWLTAVEKEPGRLQGFSDLSITGDRQTSLARFFKLQRRSISHSWGFIDPQDIAEYIATGGYFTLRDALQQFSPEKLRQLITASPLLNLDDRQPPAPLEAPCMTVGSSTELTPLELALVENNPHHLLESLLLTGYALGFSQAVIYIPAKHALAAALLERAIATAREYGLVGDHILGTDYGLEIAVAHNQTHSGGATAPHGLTLEPLQPLAHIPGLIRRAAGSGTEQPDTRIFYLSGDLKSHGFIEVPAEADLPALVQTITNKSSGAWKALQVEFPNGTFIPFDNQNTKSANTTGFMFHELVVLDRHRCILDRTLAAINRGTPRYCAGSPACETGIAALKTKLSLLTQGQGYGEVLEEIEAIARQLARETRCPTGCSPAQLVLSGLRYFRAEFAAHAEGYCPTLACKDLIRFEILQGKCKQCRCCYLVCPSGAVKNRKGTVRFFVDDRLCIKCGACAQACPFGCIKPVSEASSKHEP